MGLGLLLPHWDGERLTNWPAQEVGGGGCWEWWGA